MERTVTDWELFFPIGGVARPGINIGNLL